MSKQLIFKIVGAIASSMIVLGVFLPYINAGGNSISLWTNYGDIKSLYMPIILICFGVLPLVLFLIDKKVEFSYISFGALLLFLITQSIDIIKQGYFSVLSIGYYLLVIGTVLVGIMTFLLTMKPKIKTMESNDGNKPKETSMLEQIDRLYREPQAIQPAEQPVAVVQEVIEPLSIDTPIEQAYNPIPDVPMVNDSSLAPIEEQVPNTGDGLPISPLPSNDTGNEVNPVLEEFGVTKQPKETNQSTVNPVLQEFGVSSEQAPVSQPTPVVQSNVPDSPTPLQDSQTSNATVPDIQPIQNSSPTPNPVLQEFGVSSTPAPTNESAADTPIIEINVDSPATTPEPTSAPSIFAEDNNSSGPQATDIFGQPINK